MSADYFLRASHSDNGHGTELPTTKLLHSSPVEQSTIIIAVNSCGFAPTWPIPVHLDDALGLSSVTVLTTEFREHPSTVSRTVTRKGSPTASGVPRGWFGGVEPPPEIPKISVES